MTGALKLRPTRCAVCHIEGDAVELYPSTCGTEAFAPAVFSARRQPDRTHYRIVRCNKCGLVRSDPVADPETLAKLYARSSFTYGGETKDIAKTYGRYLSMLDAFGVRKSALLEIGCGNGFFLEEALARGYRKVRGVEPSVAAVRAAHDRVRPFIVQDIIRPGLFAPGSFDIVCLFQILDHLPDPDILLEECARLLRPGGMVLCITHNVEAVSARVMGERSPIFDVEHTYLFSPLTVRLLFRACRFEIVDVGGVSNNYSLGYLCHLAPLPPGLKKITLSLLKKSSLGNLRVRARLGNLYCVARKPPGKREKEGQ